MEPKEVKEEKTGFGRRDFLKLGIAAGLVAGIPTGLIPIGGKKTSLCQSGKL